MQDAAAEEPSAPVRPPTSGQKRAKYTSKAWCVPDGSSSNRSVLNFESDAYTYHSEYYHRRKIKAHAFARPGRANDEFVLQEDVGVWENAPVREAVYGYDGHDSVTTVNNAGSASLAGWATGGAAPASSNRHCREHERDHSRSVHDLTRPTDHAGIPAHTPEGDAFYFYNLISPPYDIMDAPSLASGVEPLGSFSWDLESLNGKLSV
ncbi:hypothetical protein PEBR_00294 [Penicillium brasilianum]|uniref:Uncharacterized protein n=1 Tax=Penicillium brasilianum TaxID=104259 RepID=A0A1S9S0I7_PENBI|nr:hypothetical protein PEBR_00294 [Penicillium brasilianum]